MGCVDERYVLLTGAAQLIRERSAARKGHYMNPALLDSRLATLETPATCIALDIADTPEVLAERILVALQ